MELKYGLISVDDHVQEPPDLWTSRLSKSQFGDRIPHLERVNGGERWLVDGQEFLEGRVARTGAFMADRNYDPTRWDEVPPAAYIPAERLKAMDAAGVDYSVLFPTVAGVAGEAFARLLKDPELELACVRAYNDWLIEEWAAASERFIPQCIVPLWPVEATVAEIRRAVAMGHRGVVFPSVPMDLREAPFVGEPEWDPVWAVCEELDVPLCLHAGSSPVLQLASPSGLARIRAEALNAVTRPVGSAFILAMYLMSRVVLRHQRLRVVFAESALSWTMCSLEWADHQFEHDGVAHEGYTHNGVTHEGYELTPYQMFQRQCYVSAWFDTVAPFAPYVGADHILWCTNMPQATSTWPRTQETINRCFKGVTDEVRQQILWRNAANLYKL